MSVEILGRRAGVVLFLPKGSLAAGGGWKTILGERREVRVRVKVFRNWRRED
jgi:hypothetical protein